jgi:hypothetical protein
MSTTQFEIADADLPEIKRRVNCWITRAEAKDYFLQVIDDRHVKVIKTKQDTKVCIYGCVGTCAAFFIGIFMVVGLIFIIVGILLVGMVLTYWYFFLNPDKVEYDVVVVGGYPSHVTITASGKLLPECQYEYESFLNEINPSHSYGGPGLAF